MPTISRKEYAGLFGPTTGDKIRLGDTNLFVEIEKDLRGYGEESVYGGGKSLRDGMGHNNHLTRDNGVLDLVITNVTIIDPIQGVIKADVGIRDGKICGIGKSGNPDVMSGISTDMVVGVSTDAISGEHLILTAAGIDTHIHLISPQQAYHGLSNGITTFFGGGIGPTDGTNGTTVTPGPWNIRKMLRAIEGLPINVGLLGKGNSYAHAPLAEQIIAGVAGLKVHEDWGATSNALRHSLRIADEMDVHVSVHTDILNAAGVIRYAGDATSNATIGQPVASTATPLGVSGHLSQLSMTPSPSASPSP